MKTIKQFIKFGIVGVINTLINLLVLWILSEYFGVYYMIAAILAFIAAVTNSFVLNKIWTFEESLGHKKYSRYLKFFIVSVFALLVNLAVLYVLVEYFKFWYIYAQLIGIIGNLIINFAGNKLWTFGK
ncbi:MAG: GtrA family protein [Candidatus Nanoarchaeia archaeon]